MIDAHLRRLRNRDTIGPQEEAAIRGLVAETRRFKANQIIIRKDERIDQSALLVEGWLARTVDLKSGKRLFTQVHVPGDFVDLHGLVLKRLDHDVLTLADSVVAFVPHERLVRLTSDYPHLTRVYWFATNVDAAIHRKWVVTLGQSAASRLAHLLCELVVRLEIAGKASGKSLDFPLTQEHLASALSLTAVHVNRTLQVLRRSALIDLSMKRLTILDWPGLQEFAEFDPAYLYLDRQPE